MDIRKLFVEAGKPWYKPKGWVTVVLILVVGIVMLFAQNHSILGAETSPPQPPPKPIHAQLVSVSLATGVDGPRCKTVVFSVPPHLHCHIGLQPGNTRFLQSVIDNDLYHGYTAGDIVGVIAGLICKPFDVINLAIALLCAAVVDYYVMKAIDQLRKASAASRCFGVDFDVFGPALYHVNWHAYGGASWKHPIWYKPWNQAIAQWHRKDKCAVNISNSGSSYHFSGHCNDSIYDSLGGNYPRYTRWNYDGINCAVWFCDPGSPCLVSASYRQGPVFV